MAPSMREGAPLLRIRGLTKTFGTQTALHPIDLSVGRGDFVALLGPSGCGKTTLLRIIGGFLAPDSGSVEIDGVDVSVLGPEHRHTNMVFQGYGLFPHMTVRQNVGYGLAIARRPQAERARDVGAILEMMHLSALADRLPTALSGGQQQRVALARALVMKPSVLLLDEPLAALDLQLRKSMQNELRSLHREIGGTFVCVTHDQGEAIALANRIAVMNGGRIVQEGTPEEIYRQPHSEFVAAFIGESNLLRVERQANVCNLAGQAIPAPGPDGPATLMIRPSDIRIVESATRDEPGLAGQIVDAVFMGDHVKIVLKLETGDDLVVHRSRTAQKEGAFEIGRSVLATWSRSDCHVLERS